MLLKENQIAPVVAEARAAFAGFTNWQTNNEKNEEYDGFAVWGEHHYASGNYNGTTFFVTLRLTEPGWRGDLTLGQPQFYWSSADMGDAILLGTQPAPTLADGIHALKTQMNALFIVLVAGKPADER